VCTQLGVHAVGCARREGVSTRAEGCVSTCMRACMLVHAGEGP